jgi:hypothetical protein
MEEAEDLVLTSVLEERIARLRKKIKTHPDPGLQALNASDEAGVAVRCRTR